MFFFSFFLRRCEELATKLQSNFALKRRSNPWFLCGGMDCFRLRSLSDGGQVAAFAMTAFA